MSSRSLTRAVGRLCWAGKETSRGLVRILRRLLQSETEGLLEANLIRRKVLRGGCHARKNLGRHRRCGDPPQSLSKQSYLKPLCTLKLTRCF